MQRGDVHLVSFDPAAGSEAGKTRPAVLVSNDGANRSASRLGRGVLTVVPLTSNTTRVYPFQLLIRAGAGGLSRDSKAQAEQVRAVDVSRLGDRLGTLPGELMAELDERLRIHLGL